MRALVLDFDGVISDSAPEAFLVALRTYVLLQPGTRLAADLSELTGGFVGGDLGSVDPARLRAHASYRGFVDAMALGNRAEDFGVVLRALDTGTPLPDQAAYDAHRDTLGREFLERFHARFYEVRQAFASADLGAWQALMAPYPPFLELLHRHAGELPLAIATAKDRASVDRLLRAYGIDGLFSPELVADKETGVSKRAHLEHLGQTLGLDASALTFVDDKVSHLDSAAALGVRCALASWGYNGPREWALAQGRGYLVVGPGDAEEQLFGAR